MLTDKKSILKDHTNEDGKQFIDRWISKKTPTKLYIQDGNFNLLITKEGTACSLPKKETGCRATFFGGEQYLDDYLKGNHSWQSNSPKIERTITLN